MENRTTPVEAAALLRTIFPDGLISADVLGALCPEGWHPSPLRAAFHPSPRDLYEESLRMRENLRSVFGRSNKKELPPPEPPPSFEEFVAGLEDPESVPDEEEAGRLAGLCLWDVFSDNHDVIMPDRRAAHLGSFRGSAGEIAEFYYNKPPAEMPDFSRFRTEADFMDYLKANMDYMEFYMGSRMIGHRASLRPVYHVIFKRLREAGCDWHYSFPRLSLVRLDHLKEHKTSARPDWETYDPSEAFAAEEAQSGKDAEISRMEESLEESHQQAIEDAKYRPPPDTVLAYQEVFGCFPSGWPPWEEEE